MKASHRSTLESIPWMVTGRIADSERQTFEKHMRECKECRDEFALQQKVHTAMNSESSRIDYAPGASLQKLWTRIGSSEQSPVSPRPTPAVAPTRVPRFRLTQWLAAAVVVEAIGITLMAVLAPMQTTVNVPPPAYIAVSTSETMPPTAILRVVFAGDYSLNEMSGLLLSHKLSIVGGPKSGGIYTLATTDSTGSVASTFPSTLSALRAHPKIRLAEPIGPASQWTGKDEKQP
jgi:hypothetical protein